MARMKVSVVEEVPYGVYVWQMPDGSVVKDEDGNYFCIAAMKGDIRRINALKKEAVKLGITEGNPLFFSGHRLITDDEYEEQKQRMEWGLVPDTLDVPAIKEDLEQKKKLGVYK